MLSCRRGEDAHGLRRLELVEEQAAGRGQQHARDIAVIYGVARGDRHVQAVDLAEHGVEIGARGEGDEHAHDDEAVEPGHGVAYGLPGHAELEAVAARAAHVRVLDEDCYDDGHNDEDYGVDGLHPAEAGQAAEHAEDAVGADDADRGIAGLKEAEDLALVLRPALGPYELEEGRPVDEGRGDAQREIAHDEDGVAAQEADAILILEVIILFVRKVILRYLADGSLCVERLRNRRV